MVRRWPRTRPSARPRCENERVTTAASTPATTPRGHPCRPGRRGPCASTGPTSTSRPTTSPLAALAVSVRVLPRRGRDAGLARQRAHPDRRADPAHGPPSRRQLRRLAALGRRPRHRLLHVQPAPSSLPVRRPARRPRAARGALLGPDHRRGRIVHRPVLSSPASRPAGAPAEPDGRRRSRSPRPRPVRVDGRTRPRRPVVRPDSRPATYPQPRAVLARLQRARPARGARSAQPAPGAGQVPGHLRRQPRRVLPGAHRRPAPAGRGRCRRPGAGRADPGGAARRRPRAAPWSSWPSSRRSSWTSAASSPPRASTSSTTRPCRSTTTRCASASSTRSTRSSRRSRSIRGTRSRTSRR